ncbi:MAG: CDP-alcohol phosphatidyltransferase family protein, partial [Sedimenticolaceae bacterium]
MTFNLQQLPNLLTLLRIVLIPVFVVVFFLPFEHARLIATVILFIAGITDWLDGFLARR